MTSAEDLTVRGDMNALEDLTARGGMNAAPSNESKIALPGMQEMWGRLLGGEDTT